MVNKLIYLLRGIINLELVALLFFSLTYYFLKYINFTIDLVQIPREVLISPFVLSCYVLYHNWQSCFRFFTILGTSDLVVKGTAAMKNINYLLYGSLIIQSFTLFLGVLGVLKIYKNDIFLGTYLLSVNCITLILAFLSLKLNLAKYHSMLKKNGIQVDNISN